MAYASDMPDPLHISAFHRWPQPPVNLPAWRGGKWQSLLSSAECCSSEDETWSNASANIISTLWLGLVDNAKLTSSNMWSSWVYWLTCRSGVSVITWGLFSGCSRWEDKLVRTKYFETFTLQIHTDTCNQLWCHVFWVFLLIVNTSEFTCSNFLEISMAGTMATRGSARNSNRRFVEPGNIFIWLLFLSSGAGLNVCRQR